MKLEKIKIYKGTKTTLKKKKLNEKILFSNLKDFICHKYICEIYKL